MMGLDKALEVGDEDGYRRSRPMRKVAGGEEEGYMGWKVRSSFTDPHSIRSCHIS